MMVEQVSNVTEFGILFHLEGLENSTQGKAGEYYRGSMNRC